MSVEARQEFQAALRARRNGESSQLDGSEPFETVKPEFYADANQLVGNVTETYKQISTQAPYDSITASVPRLERLSPWLRLELALARTATAAFNQTEPPKGGCPYTGSLDNLGSVRLKPVAGNRPELDSLRAVSAFGAVTAPALITNLQRRMPDMAALNGATDDVEGVARNSARSLLAEPMSHPQRWAAAFVFCLAGNGDGQDILRWRDRFMLEELIRTHTRLGTLPDGRQRVEWKMPTKDFVTRTGIVVVNRLLGPAADTTGDHATPYPAGTRLGDIPDDGEPTIGCQGREMAYAMWNHSLRLIARDELWLQPPGEIVAC
jgi:hypothetical protein